MSSAEKPEGFETKSVPGYVPSEPYTRDEVAQGDKPGISNTPGTETWTGNGEEETEFGAAPQGEQDSGAGKTGDASGASGPTTTKRASSSTKSSDKS